MANIRTPQSNTGPNKSSENGETSNIRVLCTLENEIVHSWVTTVNMRMEVNMV